MKSIEALEIAGFRGTLRPVEIVFGGKSLVMIYGEEKAGKSTIVDALDALCNQRHDMIAGEESPRIRLRGARQSWTVGGSDEDTVSPGGENTVSPDGSAPPRAMILRRAQTQQLAATEPKGLWGAVRTFIDLPGIARSEQALGAATAQIKEQLAVAAEKAAQGYSTMDTLWRNAGKPGDTCEVWVKGKAAVDLTVLREELDAFSSALNHLKTVEAAHGRMAQAENDAAQSGQVSAAAEAALAEALGSSDQYDPTLMDAIVRLHEYLRDRPTPEACPVCGSREKIQELQSLLAAHLERTAELRRLRDGVEAAVGASRDADAVTRQAQSEFALAAAGLSWYEGTPGAWVLADREATVEGALHCLGQAQASRPRMRKHVGVASKALQSIRMRRDVYRRWEKDRAEQRRLEELRDRLTKLQMVVRAESDRYVEARLAEVAGNVTRMYLRLCPNDRTSASRLPSLLVGSAPGQDGPGAGVPDRSAPPNLDALGVCLFLAVAQSSHRDGRLVVMDDVLVGADPAYLGRFLDLLEAEAPLSSPLIATSHYQKCLERYRGQRSGKVQLVELGRWTPQFGLVLVQMKSVREQLRTQLNDPYAYDARQAGNLGRSLLEQVLYFLVLHYNLKMPLQAQATYTLGPLLSGLKDSKLLLRDLRSEMDAGSTVLGELISDVGGSIWIGNFLSHHNSLDDIHSSDVIAFVQAVLALSDALICGSCGDLPQIDRGTFWQCGCKKGPRLFPHKRPSA